MKCVPHVARWMVRRHIQKAKITFIIFHLAAAVGLVAQIAEDAKNSPESLGGWVQSATDRVTAGQGWVQWRSLQFTVESCFALTLQSFIVSPGEGFFYPVCGLTVGFPLLRRDLSDAFKSSRNLACAAQPVTVPQTKKGLVAGLRQLVETLRLQFIKNLHGRLAVA